MNSWQKILVTKITHPWKWLSDFWGIVTILIFFWDFFQPGSFRVEATGIAIIYTAILVIYVSNKEYRRWKKNNFSSQYHGEIFIILWSLILLLFVALVAIFPDKYIIPATFYTTYITILGLFAITLNSKKLKSHRSKK